MTRRGRRGATVAVQNATRSHSMPPAAKLRAWVGSALAASANGELTIRIVGERESAALNERYRGKRGATNVLAFRADVPDTGGNESLPIGDLVICAAVVAREARAQGKTLTAHWAHMVIHGALHLQGYDHESSRAAAVMEARERALLAKLGFPDPYSIK